MGRKRRVADGSAPPRGPRADVARQPRPADPNAAWLADLYAQFIDDPEMGGAAAGKKKRAATPRRSTWRSRPRTWTAKLACTLKRLMGALKKI
ncbi:MAG: hypothetical protein R2702_18540 [Acidimicrobiales bacterium]